ncbi:hypothetical protein R1flu_018040 [Riccia fluitans]|uniref:Uncharacterized protein n=1 Tax=Riccia fluitans TaxID=41844 RepID=A0ABD1ZFR4_9MARC
MSHGITLRLANFINRSSKLPSIVFLSNRSAKDSFERTSERKEQFAQSRVEVNQADLANLIQSDSPCLARKRKERARTDPYPRGSNTRDFEVGADSLGASGEIAFLVHRSSYFKADSHLLRKLEMKFVDCRLGKTTDGGCGVEIVTFKRDCWERAVCPKGFMEGITILIPKELGADTLRALRPITLLSTVYKLFAKVIASRLA